MAIKRNAAPSGNYVKAPGEYRVKVVETKVGLNKKGKNMLTVKFRTADDLEICGYFTQGVNFHQHNLKELKTACGIDVKAQADQMIGKECGILVESQDPDPETQKVFMQIVGYDKADAVSGHSSGIAAAGTLPGEDQIPF